METTLYDDISRVSVKRKKMGMSLDLQSISTQQENVVIKQEVLNNEILSTPDLGLFMLASPDLERLIVTQQNGLVLTTPTPTTQILFPKSVTEEQEAYARGFVDALGELYKSYGKPQTGVSSCSETVAQASTINSAEIFEEHDIPVACAEYEIVTEAPPVAEYTKIHTIKPPARGNMMPPRTVYNFHSSKPTTRSSTIATRSATVIHQSPHPEIDLKPTKMDLKPSKIETKPQTVPSRTTFPVADDETVRLEHKRARNRLAATRCRNRKLERISRLEDRVAELRGENNLLMETADDLRDQVFRLKQCLLEHSQQGCHVVINHDFL